MSNNKKKVYPAEFKESAVKLALESGNSIAQTARELGIKEKTIYNWISLYSKPKSSIQADREMNHPSLILKNIKKAVVN